MGVKRSWVSKDGVESCRYSRRSLVQQPAGKSGPVRRNGVPDHQLRSNARYGKAPEWFWRDLATIGAGPPKNGPCVCTGKVRVT